MAKFQHCLPLLTLLLLMTMKGQAQDCGCVNCPLEIRSDQTDYELCYDVFNIANNDLGNVGQGICNINLSFTHQSVKNLEISLRSPGNQFVQLIGDFDPVGLTTNIGTTFDVSFVPSAEIPSPDAGHNERWTNTDFTEAGVNYIGTYHPYADDLEDFNFGAVNGQWCLVITNHGAPVTGFDGQIEEFAIEFCDETGRDCCFADAGELNTTSFAACQGASELNLSGLEPVYEFSAPDPDSFDYSYVIARGDILMQIVTLPPDLSDSDDFSHGTFKVCGLSHHIDANLAPTSSDPDQPYGLTTIESFRNQLTGNDPPFCGNLTDDCIEITIQSPPADRNLTESICRGDSYMVGMHTFSEAIDTTILLQTAAGCDSTVNLNLSVVERDTTRLTEIICVDEVYFVGTLELDSSGFYDITLLNEAECDSTILLDLTIQPKLETELDERICRGESYPQGDSIYTHTGNYMNMFTSVDGCDSTVFLNLVVDTIDVRIVEPQMLTCANSVITLDGTPSDETPDYIYEWEVVGGEGNLTGATNQRTAQVDRAGTYRLTITDTSLNNCSASETITVTDNLTEPTAIIEEEGTLTCVVNQIQLNANNSSGQSTLTYEWNTTDGNVVGSNNQSTVAIDQPGEYELTVTDQINGCSSSATFNVVPNHAEPNALASVNETLTCNRTMVTLDGSGSTEAQNISYLWTTSEGNITAGETTLSPQVDATGIYTLTVTDNDNGCSSSDTVQVNGIFTEPEVRIAPVTEEVSCQVSSVQIDASESEQGEDFLATWTTTNGHIVEGTENQLMPSVTEAGTYQLTIVNQITGCQSAETITVGENFIRPNALAGNPNAEQITCRRDSVRLDGAASSGMDDLLYSWEDVDGNLLGEEVDFFAKVEGLYFLIIEDIANGCRDTTSVAVTANFDEPIVEAGANVELNCAQPERNLDGAASATGTNFSYLWDGPGITEGDATTTPQVNQAGIYYLTVLNNETGCTAVDSVMVTLDDNLPLAMAGVTDTITCSEDRLQLNGNGSMGNNITYEWTSLDSHPIEDANTLNPTVTSGGRYILTVTNNANQCVASDTVDVVSQLEPPIAQAGLDGIIDCTTSEYTPDTNGSSASEEFIYTWTTTDGNIVSGATTLSPVLDAAGQYILEITNTNTGCVAMDTLDVSANLHKPTAIIDPVDNLTCQESQRILNGGNSTGENNLTYEWRTINGSFSTATDEFQTTVNQEGSYTLIVTDMVSGCIDSTVIQVDADIDIPNAVTTSETAIDCTSGTINLSGNGSSTGDNFIYNWGTTDGRFTPTSDPLEIIAQAAGTYTLIVTNTDNDCTAESTVTVTQNCTPEAIATTNDTITCFEPMAILSSEGSSQGDNFTLNWLDSLGMTISMADTLQVNRGGLYILEITSNVSGETERDSIVVVADQTPPIVDAGEDLTLDCTNTMLQLDGTNSSTGDNFEFVWTSLSDGFVGDDSLTLTPTIDEAGIYDLEIINTENGCRAVDAVQVRADETLLEICINTTTDFACGQNELTIDATCSTQNDNTTYTWTTTDGNILSGGNTLQPMVNRAGVYTLLLEDTANGCSTTEDVEVTEPNCDFSINVSPDTSINCNRTEVVLSGQITPPGDNYVVSWLNSNDEIVGQDTLLTVTIGDTYTFVVRELQTGTEDSARVIVEADTLTPRVNAGQDAQFDCQTDTLRLAAIANILEPIYQWSGLDGQVIFNPDTATITVTEIGEYVVQITDPNNGCTATDTVSITNNPDLPTAFAGTDTTFTCRDATLRLSGDGSTTGDDIRYNWTVVGDTGEICGQATTLNPTICEAGVYQLEVINEATGCTSTDLITVDEDINSPQIMAGEGTTLTCVDSTFTLNGTGPTADNFTLLWRFENGDTLTTDTYQPTVNTAGEYFLVVMDMENGCSSVAQTVVRIDTIAPMIDAGTTQAITCEDNRVTLNGSIENNTRTYAIQWSGMPEDSIENDSLLSPTVYQGGVYTLLVTDELNGCQSQDSVQVTLDDNIPDAFAGEDENLTCQNEQINLTGTSSAMNVTYQWQDTSGTVLSNEANLTVTQAGIYNLIVLDTLNNCAVVDEVVITDERTDPDVVIQTLLTELDCNNNTTTLHVESENENANYTYQWTRFGSNTILGIADSLVVNEGGEYQLTATDETNDCTTILTQSIESNGDFPIVNINPAADFGCQTDSINLSATASDDNLNFLWTDASGDTLATELNTTIFASGEYTFTATNPANGCEASSVIQIKDTGEIPDVAINSNTTQLTCFVNEVQLTSSAAANLNYEWSDSQGSIIGLERNLTVNTAGQYILTVTNPQTNCTNQDSITIIAEDAFINGFDIALTEPTCFGEGRGSVIINEVIGGTEPYNYSLNGAPFKAFPQFDFLSPATYTLTVEDAFGCQRDTIFTIDEGRSIVVDLGGDQTILLGESITIEAQANDEIQLLEWNTKDTLECADCPVQTFNPLETTTYGIMVMNTVGCIATDEVTIQVAKERSLYFPTIFSPNGDESNEVFFIGGGKDVEIIEMINIYDRWGTLMFNAQEFLPNDPTHGWDGTFEGKDLNPGVFIYYARVRFKDGMVKMMTGDITLIK